MVMEIWISLHSSARTNIKWPFVKPTFIVHGGQSTLLPLSDLPPLVIIHAKAPPHSKWLSPPGLELLLQGPGGTRSARLSSTQPALHPPTRSAAGSLFCQCQRQSQSASTPGCQLRDCFFAGHLCDCLGVPRSLYLDPSVNWQVRQVCQAISSIFLIVFCRLEAM